MSLEQRLFNLGHLRPEIQADVRLEWELCRNQGCGKHFTEFIHETTSDTSIAPSSPPLHPSTLKNGIVAAGDAFEPGLKFIRYDVTGFA